MSADLPSPTRPRVRLTPDRRRHQILTQAARLIGRAGFNAVSLADIANACGISKPTVLHYFPTMGDLLRGVLAQRDIDAGDVYTSIDGLDGPAEVSAYLRRFVEGNVGSRELVRLYVVLRTEAFDDEHPAHDYFEQRADRALSELQALLSWKDDPRLAAQQLLAFWLGLESIWVNDPALDFLAVWDAFSADFFV